MWNKLVSAGPATCTKRNRQTTQSGIYSDDKQKEYIMNVEKVTKIIERLPNLSTALGMRFISTPDEDMCMAVMKVDERNRQPFGFLSGGASLALAENVAGVGSTALCPRKICVGVSVSGQHVKAVAEGDTVTALAHLVSKGRKLHVWQVNLTNSAGELISTVHVTNYIITPRTSSNRSKDNAGQKEQ